LVIAKEKVALGILWDVGNNLGIVLWYRLVVTNLCCALAIFVVTNWGLLLQVTVLIEEHTCTSSARRKTTTPTSAWVALKVIHLLKKESNMGPKELRKRLEEKYKCEIQYDTVWAWAYGRPYLSIDSTALNGRWNGHMAAATTIDGHNWMYPLAFGYIDGETDDNWVWFMSQLKKAIGDLPLLFVCTDACKGLENSVKLVFPQADQRECFRHLMQNFVKRFGGDIFSKMYPTARAYRAEVSQFFYNQVVEASPDVKKWLDTYHMLKWRRSHQQSS
jgi:hypothetical protein